jgi:hypothetical protein
VGYLRSLCLWLISRACGFRIRWIQHILFVVKWPAVDLEIALLLVSRFLLVALRGRSLCLFHSRMLSLASLSLGRSFGIVLCPSTIGAVMNFGHIVGWVVVTLDVLPGPTFVTQDGGTVIVKERTDALYCVRLVLRGCDCEIMACCRGRSRSNVCVDRTKLMRCRLGGQRVRNICHNMMGSLRTALVSCRWRSFRIS